MVPYPYPQRSLVPLRPDSTFQGSYLVFACVKRPFCMRKLPFFTYQFFSTRDAKYPCYLRKIRVNACFLPPPPPLTRKHEPTSRVQCMPCVQANMEAIAGILLCIVRIILSHMSKWYSTTKPPEYAQQKCNIVRQTCQKPYNFPLRITLSQYCLAFPYASWRVQEGCQTLNPLAYNP